MSDFPEAKYTMTFAEVLSLIPTFWDGITSLDLIDKNGDAAGTHNKKFAQEFYDRYAFDEIEYGTIDRFSHELNVRLQRILPKYNAIFSQLYADGFSFSPFDEYEANGTATNSTSIDSNNTTHGFLNDRPVTKNSITVQNPTDSTTDPASLVTGAASSISANTGLSKSTTGSSSSNTNKGRNQSKLKIMREFLSQYLNAENELIDELKDLFIQML